MLTYTLRRTAISIPTLLVISLVIFLLLELSPGDPMAQVPLTVPDHVKELIRASLGLNGPWYERYLAWMTQFFWIEPLYYIQWLTNESSWFGWLPDTDLLTRWVPVTDNPDTYAHYLEQGFTDKIREHGGETQILVELQRMISYKSRGPVFFEIGLRIPQTLWVVGMAYLVGVLIALPIGIISAYRQYSVFDNAGTFVSMIGFSVPPFFSGVLMIVIFTVNMPRESFWWFPSIYDTTLVVDGWAAFGEQIRQMVLPVMVLALQTTAQISRYMRASMLDNLNQDYVRTARAKGLSEWVVVMIHVLRNSMIPVITVIALGAPAIFGGAIITERVFKVNGIGDQLIGAVQANDVPVVMALTFIFAILIVLFNLIADILYGLLDPRIRYD